MEKDCYAIDGHFCTIKKLIDQLQTIANNVGEDKPCFHLLIIPQDVKCWGPDIEISDEIAEDLVDNLWFYNEVQKTVRKVIEHELDLQLKKRNLTLEDFRFE